MTINLKSKPTGLDFHEVPYYFPATTFAIQSVYLTKI